MNRSNLRSIRSYIATYLTIGIRILYTRIHFYVFTNCIGVAVREVDNERIKST